jgi:hypothetical protein
LAASFVGRNVEEGKKGLWKTRVFRSTGAQPVWCWRQGLIDTIRFIAPYSAGHKNLGLIIAI